MPDAESAYAYGTVPHPRWCDRAACSIFRTDVCHRSTARTVDSSGGRVSVWVESWDRVEGGVTGAPAVVVEAGGQGCGSILYPAEAIDLILALVYQVARATGAPKRWRSLRLRRFREQAERISARLSGAGCQR